MTREETMAVITEIIEESAKSMKRKAEELLKTRDWDFDTFGDRNTFARVVMECLYDEEKYQYQAINNTRAYKALKNNLEYELGFIH